jgi:hypothetical protein
MLDQVPNTARRVSLLGHTILGWVGAPMYNATEQVWISLVVGQPIYDGIYFPDQWPDVLHLTGCEIAPGQSYVVQAIEFGSDELDEAGYSEVLVLKTAPVWGDVVSTCPYDVCEPPQGDPFTQPNIDDVLALVNAFQGVENAPLAWLDIDPVVGNGYPEGTIAIGDVLVVVLAFTGQPYPGNGPLGCP